MLLVFGGVRFSRLNEEPRLLRVVESGRTDGRTASKEVEMIWCEGGTGSQKQPTLLPAQPKFAFPCWKDAHRQFVAPVWRAAAEGDVRYGMGTEAAQWV
jgi:hypothetical protein